MDLYYDLAYSLANESLCLFLGTGFSKNITAGKVPSWAELLLMCSDSLTDRSIADNLFSAKGKKNVFPLEDCAQMLELAFKKEGKDFRATVSNIINSTHIDATASKAASDFISKHNNLKIITTNFDVLVEREILKDVANVFYTGKPIPKRFKDANIYHIHGCVDFPEGMILTSSDYFRFINSPNYFSKKITTLIHENTVLIMGYSLSDPNLKIILNSYKLDMANAASPVNIFFVARDKYQQHIKDYFEIVYGITVIDGVQIDEAFNEIEKRFTDAKNTIDSVESILEGVINGTAAFDETYFLYYASLCSVIAASKSKGYTLDNPNFSNLIVKMLRHRISLSQRKNAWNDYVVLADWLIYLGSVYSIPGTRLEKDYLETVQYSMKNMSEKYFGSSWQAFVTWKETWYSLKLENRELIKNMWLNNHLIDAYEDVRKVVLS
jgi:hypothetical protein